MLTDAQLSFDLTDDGRVLPRWLSSRDEVWVRAFIEQMRACAGRPAEEMDEHLREVGAALALRQGRAPRVAAGVWQVERRHWKTTTGTRADPSRVRAVTFELASRLPKDEALLAASQKLTLSPDEILEALFADRPGKRLRVPPPEASTPAEVVSAYNLALAQAFLIRSTAVTITVSEHARRVVGYAKLRGLLATFEEADQGRLRIRLDGPLALFRATTKYGRALAEVLPTLATTLDFRLSADLVVRGGPLKLDLDASAPLPRVHALPRRTDSAVEERLLRDLHRIVSPWSVQRESAAIKVGKQLFFPDFTLQHPRGVVLVEVVGFWTQDYLDAKVRALAAAKRPLIVCVDARHAQRALPGLEAGPSVLHYKRWVDAQTLLRMAERCLEIPSSERG